MERKSAVIEGRGGSTIGSLVGGVLSSSGSVITANAPSAEEAEMLEIEEDKDDIRYFPVEITPGATRLHQRVKAASSERLVEWLTSPKYSGTHPPTTFFHVA